VSTLDFFKEQASRLSLGVSLEKVSAAYGV
jgi:hypothetical protein